MFASSLFALGLAALSSAAPLSKKRADNCNGHSELCDRTFDNVTFVGAHNSYTNSKIWPSANQEWSITEQLDAGIRLLQAQAHKKTVDDANAASSNISLCHTDCLLYDGGTLENFLGTIKGWMDDHPTEVVSMLFVNSDGVEPNVWKMAYESSGMSDLSWAPGSKSLALGEWPTLGSLIDDGKRAISFMDSGANFDEVPYIIDEFSNMWETPFDVTDPAFPCDKDRGDGDVKKTMGIINHFLDKKIVGDILVPDKDKLDTTNSAEDVVKQANDCVSKQGHLPTILLLDFVNHGDPFAAADQLNGF